MTQPLTEISIRNLPGGKVWPVHKADSLTARCEPSVQCVNIDASQLYGRPQPVTRIGLP
jgi:hypothetical protein